MYDNLKLEIHGEELQEDINFHIKMAKEPHLIHKSVTTIETEKSIYMVLFLME